jgi:hypothetical protein
MSYENGLWTWILHYRHTRPNYSYSGRRFLQLVIVVIERVSGRSVNAINIIGLIYF